MTFNGKYQIIRVLNSEGSYGTLFEVEEQSNEKNHYALKLMKKKYFSEYEKEKEVMTNIKSKYIIEYKDDFYDKTNEGYCIVMELCDGDLRKILDENKPKGLPLNMINKIFIQLNEALKTIIENGYSHRDLKPENILIKYTDKNKINFDIKLTDFGLSTYEIHSSIKTYSYAGSNNYMAPEIETFHYNNKCDLWSLGVILYELYTNNYIFYSTNPIERETNRYYGKIENETDNEAINKLIKKLIQIDIDKRIKWEEYFNDEFFKNNNEININENEQIIKIKYKKNINDLKFKVFNEINYINKNNIKISIENENKEFKEEFNNLKEGTYNIIIKINQTITNCEDMFKNCENIIEINFIKFDTKDVNNMSFMFYNCSSLKNLDVSKFNTENVIEMSSMFENCTSLNNLNVDNFDIKNVINLSDIFKNCKFDYDKNKFK